MLVVIGKPAKISNVGNEWINLTLLAHSITCFIKILNLWLIITLGDGSTMYPKSRTLYPGIGCKQSMLSLANSGGNPVVFWCWMFPYSRDAPVYTVFSEAWNIRQLRYQQHLRASLSRGMTLWLKPFFVSRTKSSIFSLTVKSISHFGC